MGTTRLKQLALIALMGGATACVGEDVGPARFSADMCRRISLIDESTGAPVVGAEDIAFDAERGRLFISAYDRRAVEKAARKRLSHVPSGGIYVAQVSALKEAEKLSVTPVMAPGDIAGGLRPHGLSYDGANHELVFVNRTYQQINGRWNMTPRLQRIGANGEVFVGPATDARCGANDVVTTRQQLFFSFDHDACGWRAAIEDVFRLRRSGVAMDSKKVVFSNAAFANGIAHAQDGMIALSATRDRQILLFNERAEELELTAAFDVPGGPDNLSVSADGGVVAAVHPSLFRLALNRKLGVGKTPSRIVKIDRNGGTTTLFDDRSGKQFSAATIGIELNGMLVAGSVTDAGLLVCKAPA